MARYGINALFAATILGVGINASPCKPYSSAAMSSAITINPTTTELSTFTTEVTDTTDAIETTVTTDATDSTEVLETTVTVSATETSGTLETTVTETTAATTADISETTTTGAVIETSAATIELTTTTVAESGCVETQILINTGFDDNNDGSPWSLGTGSTISQSGAQSSPNYIYNTLNPGRSSTSFSQDLPALGSFSYYLKYSYRLRSALQPAALSCRITPKINSQTLASSQTISGSGPIQFQTEYVYFVPDDPVSPATLSLSVSCQGSYSLVEIGIDDVTLTSACNLSD